MNEKMIELYRQAHVPCTMIDPSNNMPVPWKEFSAEKFSELIVKECIKVAGTEMGYSQYCAMREKIEEHFGVK